MATQLKRKPTRKAMKVDRKEGWPREGLATVEQAIQFLSLGRNAVYNLINSNRIRSLKISPKARRIEWPSLHEFAGSR